jgi:hypothetical protein
VYGVIGDLISLNPPPPPPPPEPFPPPPPPATTIYETTFSGAQELICETQKVPGPVKV